MSKLNPGQTVESLRNTSMVEQSQITPIADTGAYDVQTLTFGAFELFAQGDFFIAENVAGDKIAVWFDLDANGTEPNGALYAATDVQVEVNIATGNTATQVAAAVQAAIATAFATADMTTTNPSAGVVRIVQDLIGVTVAAEGFIEAETDPSAGITAAVVTAGVASNLQNTYFTLNSPTVAYAVWFNVGDEGVDPEVEGKTMIECAIDAGASASTIASALATVLEAEAAFNANVHNGGVQVRNAVVGTATDIGAGDSGFTVALTNAGQGASLNGSVSGSPADIGNNPSVV